MQKEEELAAEADLPKTQGDAISPNPNSGFSWVNIPGTGRRQVAVFMGVEYVVLSVEKLSSIEETKADDTFYLVNMAVANTTKRTVEIKTDDIVLLDDAGREFARSDDGSSALRSADRERTVATYLVPVQSSLTKRFTLVYDAPGDTKGLQIKIPSASGIPLAASNPSGE